MQKTYTKDSVITDFPVGVAGVATVLRTLGADITKGAMEETPQRHLSGLLELTWGMRVPEDVFLKSLATEFDVGYDEMIVVKKIDIVSLCEHHMLPILGRVKIGYIPSSDKVLGLSKLARLAKYYAARPQTQERLTYQIAQGLEKLIPVKGVAVKIKAAHLCMSIRGVKSPNARTVTKTLRGAFMENAATRAEFLGS